MIRLPACPDSNPEMHYEDSCGDLIKCLFYDRQGMCLYAKKLDRGRFVWPQAKDGVVSLTMGQFSMLVEAIDWRNTAWTARPEVVV